jgi:hypothetical protein
VLDRWFFSAIAEKNHDLKKLACSVPRWQIAVLRARITMLKEVTGFTEDLGRFAVGVLLEVKATPAVTA